MVNMEGTSVLLNTSVNNDSLGEFPYWKTTLAISLFGGTSSVCVLIILHLLVLVALVKTKKDRLRPLNLIHASLLVSSILEDILRIVLNIIYSPSIFRNCICSAVVGTIIISETEFFSVYRPVAFASLGVLQFLVVSGKKKLVNLKVAFGVIGISTGISLIFVASTVRLFYESNERPYCFESYCPESRPESGFGDLAQSSLLVILGSFLPSLAIVFVMSTWSCAVFKKYYIGGDDQLNRRILSLPVVMRFISLYWWCC